MAVHLRSEGATTNVHPIWNHDRTRAFPLSKADDVTTETSAELNFSYSGRLPDLPLLTLRDEATGTVVPLETSVTLPLVTTP